MKKKRKTKQAIKDLHLDKPTSHGGWPHGHSGGYTDPNTPVNKQIADYLEAMGLIDDSNPRAKLSENKIRVMIREILSETFETYFPPSANRGDVYEKYVEPKVGEQVKIIRVDEKSYHVQVLNHPTYKHSPGDPGWYLMSKIYFNIDQDTFHRTYKNIYMAPRYT